MTQRLRDRYEVIETVGAGGEGRVVKALDTQHDRVVALKIRSVSSEGLRDELLREARILYGLGPHAGLPVVREDFFEGDEYVVAMDWVDGTDLAKLVDERGAPGLPPSSVMTYLAQVAEALTHLHTHDPPVVHGDIKPANLVLAQTGRIVLVDFGVSSSPTSASRRSGTPGFLAPEVASGGAPTRASDVYALAATAHALLTGEAPSGDRSSFDLIDSAYASAIEAAIRRGLATDPAARPASAGELVERLRAGWTADLPTGVLTFCLTDIESSTPQWDHHPDEMARALVRHDTIVAEVVASEGGRLIQSMGEGDSTVSVFQDPAAAVRAMTAAVAAVDAERWPPPVLIRIRAGVHTGEIELRDGVYFGTTINKAARVRGHADGGQILLSQVTAELVSGAGVELVDLGPHTLRGLRGRETLFAVSAPGLSAPPRPSVRPFRGLLPFGPEDEEFFFGREHVVDALVARLRDAHLFAVVGASGSGKSSVVGAGLVTRVRAGAVRAATQVATITPGAQPLKTLETVVASPVLVVDQFEELFTLCDDASVRERFVDALLAWDGKVVIALRADFYGECAAFPALARAISDNQILLGPMQPDELRRAIEAPAAHVGLRFESGLVDVVLRDVAGEPGALPLLEHALLETWERRDGRTLTLEGYEESGGVRGAIALTAEREFEDLDDTGRTIARRIFLRLTTLGEGAEDTRRRAHRDELRFTDASGADVDDVLSRLVDARLVTVDEDRVDVAHEALIREWPRLRSWLDEDREHLRLQAHVVDAARAWESMGRDPGELYRGARLAAVLESPVADLNPTEHAFIEESRAGAERERATLARTNRRLWTLLAGAAIALVVALVAGGVALVQRSSARAAATRAEVSKLAAQSREVSQTKPDLGMLLAVEAYRHEDSIEARGAVLSAIATHPSLQTQLYGVTSNPTLAYSPDGKLLAAVSNVEAIFYDTATREKVGAVLHASGRRWWSARFTNDGRYLAIANDPGNVELWDVGTREHTGDLEGIDGSALAAVRFSPDGKLAAAGGVDVNHVTFFDMSTRKAIGDAVEVHPPEEGGVHEFAFSPDGSTLAVPVGGGINFVDVKAQKVAGTLPMDADATGYEYLSARRGIVSAADGTVSVWDLEARERISQVATGEKTAASAPRVSPDGRLVASSTENGRTFVWEISTGAQFGPVLQADSQQFLDTQWSPDGKTLATAHSRSVALWDMTGRQAISAPIGDEAATVLGVAFSPDGKILALGHREGLVVLRDAKTLRTIGELHPKGDTLAIAFSPDGTLMATAGQDTKVQLWDVAGRRKAGTLDLDRAWAWDVAFSPDGKLIAVGTDPNSQRDWYVPDREGAALLFDTRTHRRVGRPMVPGKGNFSVLGVAFSPDGRLLVTGSYYYRTQLWDVATQTRHGRAMDVPDEGIIDVAFSPDGRTVAAAGGSGIERLWNVENQRPATAPLEGQANVVTGITFSPDGRYLADTTLNGGVRLWDAKTGVGYGDRELIASDRPVSVEPDFDFPEPARAAFSPDGRFLAIGGIDNRPMLLRIDPAVWAQRACAVAGRNLTREEWNRYLPDEPYRKTCPP